MDNPKDILKEAEKNVKRLASDMGKQMKHNPWPFLAGVTVVSLLMGFLLGKGTKG